MTRERGDDAPSAARLDRFRRTRAALRDYLRALLGPRAAVDPVDDLVRAERLLAEYRASERAVEGRDWALVRHSWPLADLDETVDALHRLSNNLGARDAWLLLNAREPQACPLSSDAVLDNPLGFAALGGAEMRLLDRQVPAGLWLGRHAMQGELGTDYEWELIVWGEPWLSAATRALRGIG